MVIISAKKFHHSFHNTPPSSREETSQLFVKQSIHLAVGNHAIESPSQDRNLIKMIEPFKQNHWITAYQWRLLFHKLIVCNILMSAKIKHSSLWHAVPEKNNNFFEQKIFFCAVSSCSWRLEILFLCSINFFCWYETVFHARSPCFCRHQNIFCANQAFFSKQNCFSCNNKFFFWTLFRMLCHGDIFLLSRSNKKIIKFF